MLLAVQMERMRVEEALAARDNVVAHLEDAHISVRQKAATILRLEQELKVFKRTSTPANTLPSGFESDSKPGTPQSDSSQAAFEELEDTQGSVYSHHSNTVRRRRESGKRIYALVMGKAFSTVQVLLPIFEKGTPADRSIAARQAMLAILPLPSGIPDDALQPIMIHPPHTLHEFLGNSSGPTTYWCPDREEHGYFLTPVFKCSTNPRVTTAHRWSTVDVIGRMIKPTECFYTKDGKSYYAGTYKAFRMDDLTVQEWESLSPETTQAIVKETLAGRKNVSPQNHYETSQLYAAGALRVACIGLHCVGFSDGLYRGVLEQSRFAYWGRSPAWTPVRSTIASETNDDDKSTPP
ncbi:hypothetical protein HD554DRAFT_2241937 [Boletus coccyginus]|nr:hypothetical protein HD554DRAFT_2241937 [Boletus coccyginus]